MAFNRGPFAGGSSVAIAGLALVVGITRGRGYETGLAIVERVAAATAPGDDDRWRATASDEQ
ncbi:hypothetical protein [Halobacterium zhouii]|uniref:hypothetical protein n=1 Tax=Halobacterium zhouii TaxID=2902624 RepID=UPI001E4EC7A5|nr:hypothetical protein [Halobacterium zhouii]